MTANGSDFLITFVLTGLLVIFIIALHYEALLLIQRYLPILPIQPRLRIACGVFFALSAHAIEAWVFAIAYWLFIEYLHLGLISGTDNVAFLDYVYFSFVSYTTVGFGDLVPHGHVRFLSNMESLTGFVVITWTASFLFMEMEKHWRERKWD